VALGERLGGFIYGTILALAVLVGAAKAYPDDPWKIVVLLSVTAVVFWLAHVYAHSVAHVFSEDRRLSFGELRGIARHEASIVEAALPLVGAMLLAAFGLVSTRTAVWIAYGLGLGVLIASGLVFARADRLSPLATLVVVALNVALGLVLVALKLLVH
jgi:prepilin signal peptidase PulO-like enzyme (type II secretory pathway)